MVRLATESTSGPLQLGIQTPTDTMLSTARAQYPGPKSPVFVGDNYFCDSGNPDNRKRGWYLVDMVTNPLWNCDECDIPEERKCCKEMRNEKREGEEKCDPWFTTNVGKGKDVTDDTEVR